MTIDERLDRLTNIVDTLASSVVAHDDQLEKLILLTERNSREIKEISRQFEAYLNTIHPKQ